MSAFAQLSPAQIKAITALASGATVEEAASEADVTSRTVRRWRSVDEAFNEALSEARQEAFREGLATLQGATKRATRVLITALDCEVEPARLRAANIVFQHVLKAHEQLDLSQRLDELERELRQRKREF